MDQYSVLTIHIYKRSVFAMRNSQKSLHNIGIFVWLSFILILLIILPADAGKSRSDGRLYIVNLYVPEQQKPIEDMVIELDEELVVPASGNEPLSTIPAGKTKIFFKSPHKLRAESVISAPGSALDQKTIVLIKDGKNAWQYISEHQCYSSPKPDNQIAPLVIPFGIARYPSDEDRSYTVIGEETVDNIRAKVIEITSQENTDEESKVWIDVERHVPLRLQLIKKSKIKKTVFTGISQRQRMIVFSPSGSRLIETGQCSAY